LDVEKQIAYWREGAIHSWRTVPVLEEGEFWAEALFWAHLSVEKALKAHVAKVTKNIPPRIHNLARLAETGKIVLTQDQTRLAEALTNFQHLTRYPDREIPEPDAESSRRWLREAKEFREWLLEKL
jgi:HEPN domain-containing protein